MKLIGDMESLFCTYNQALALKELGFNEPCMKEYHNEISCNNSTNDENTNSDLFELYGEGVITSPLKSQVFKWFRDEHNIVHTVYSNASGYIWELHYNKERGGTHICDSEESGDCELSGMFTTYEGAESACIDKLISLIKEKKS